MPKLSSAAAVGGVIVFGTAASLLAKLIYSVHGINSHGVDAPFTKPWFQVLGMFVGMSICIVLDLPRPSSTSAERARLLDSAEPAPPPRAGGAVPWIITAPTLLDLFATACGTTGLLYTPVSVYQMLRGAQLIFTALFSVIFLRRRLSLLNGAGIALCTAGIVGVGLANVAAADAPGSARRADVIFGVCIIILGQVLQAAQVVLEEHLLQNLSMSSVRVVAWEGVFGTAHCLLWVFPLVFVLPGGDGGHLEDGLDSFYMLAHSLPVAAVVVLDMCLMLAYNVCGMEVTNNLSAVARVIIETLRTLFVWLCDLVLFYVISGRRLGEAWTEYSWIQAAGFALTVAGTVVYNYESLAADYARTQKAAAAAGAPATAAVVDEMLVGAGPEPHHGAISPSGAPPSASKPPRALTAAEEGAGGAAAVSHPLKIGSDYGDESSESGGEEDEFVSSFASGYVGSATHGSFLGGNSMPRRRAGFSPVNR